VFARDAVPVGPTVVVDRRAVLFPLRLNLCMFRFEEEVDDDVWLSMTEGSQQKIIIDVR